MKTPPSVAANHDGTPARIKPPFPVTLKTKKFYELKLRSMLRYGENLRRESEDLTEAVPVTLTDSVNDLLERLKRNNLSLATFKVYRSALLWEARNTASRPRSPAELWEALEVIEVAAEI